MVYSYTLISELVLSYTLESDNAALNIVPGIRFWFRKYGMLDIRFQKKMTATSLKYFINKSVVILSKPFPDMHQGPDRRQCRVSNSNADTQLM